MPPTSESHVLILQELRRPYTVAYFRTEVNHPLARFAALRGVHGEETVDEEVSLYYVANEMATTYHGMMIAIPAPEWDVFYAMSPADLADILLDLAERVRLQTIRKSPRRPKKPRSQRKKPVRKGHVATAKLLMNRQAKSATP